MTCDEYQEQVSLYIDGELSDRDSEKLFKHLSTCAECRSFLRSTLELRSKIHDETLRETEAARFAQPTRFTTTFALPLVALLVAFFLFLGIAQTGTTYQYGPVYPQQTAPALPSVQGNPY